MNNCAAIYYHPEAYSISGPRLMGRNAAGESFLRGFISYSTANQFWLQVQKREHAESFISTTKAHGITKDIKIVDKMNLNSLSGAGSVYYPGPGIGDHAWQRSAFGHASWSLCGITHTTASSGAMDSVTDWLTTPVQPWDAVICTSNTVKDNILRLLQAQGDYLAQRLGAQKFILPQLPVIPLGIHSRDFTFSAEQREKARKAVAADDRTIVVLFMGRLSFHAKAHPLAMYQALEKASRTLEPGQKIVLLECGWFANDFISEAFSEASRAACPDIRVIHLDGRKSENRETAWACADIFCSLSDNIQETFGIVPVEAMAAGLPVVVSDWDGYKETVRDGIDGFKIPTTMPGPGLGGDLALRHALEIDTYDMYCGHACSLVAVDVNATAQAFSKLFNSAGLRRSMGEAGKKRAREFFDWAAIIPRYEALWSELKIIRNAGAEKVVKATHPWPARMDPFASFARYPTQTLSPETIISLSDNDLKLVKNNLFRFRKLSMVGFDKVVLPDEKECDFLLEALEMNNMSAGELVQIIPENRRVFVFRSLVWLLKLGVLKVIPSQHASG